MELWALNHAESLAKASGGKAALDKIMLASVCSPDPEHKTLSLTPDPDSDRETLALKPSPKHGPDTDPDPGHRNLILAIKP